MRERAVLEHRKISHRNNVETGTTRRFAAANAGMRLDRHTRADRDIGDEILRDTAILRPVVQRRARTLDQSDALGFRKVAHARRFNRSEGLYAAPSFVAYDLPAFPGVIQRRFKDRQDAVGTDRRLRMPSPLLSDL